MKKKTLITVGVIALAALVCLVCLLAIPTVRQARMQEYYVNQIYFLLVDTAQGLDKGESAAGSMALHKNLAALQSKCDGIAMSSGYYFPLDDLYGYLWDEDFWNLSFTIQREAYRPEELKQMAADLREIVAQLSDKTGTSPRRNVSYDELGRLLSDFLRKWDRPYEIAF